MEYATGKDGGFVIDNSNRCFKYAFEMGFKLHLPNARPNASQAATRQLLLEAAGEVFAERGFKAASVREICQRAGANVAAVNYHFGDKETLYAEVLKYALRCAREQYPPTFGLRKGATVEQRLHAFVHSFLLRIFDGSRSSWHGRLMSHEMLEPTGALEGTVKSEIRPIFEELQEIIRDLLPPRPKPELVRRCAFSIVSQCVFFHHCRPVVVRMFPNMTFDPARIAELAEHISRFSLLAIQGLGRSPDRGPKQRKAK